MPNLLVLSLQVEREEILFLFVSLFNDVVVAWSTIRHQELDFFHAAHGLKVLFFEVDLLMKDLIGQANDSPPEDVA